MNCGVSTVPWVSVSVPVRARDAGPRPPRAAPGQPAQGLAPCLLQLLTCAAGHAQQPPGGPGHRAQHRGQHRLHQPGSRLARIVKRCRVGQRVSGVKSLSVGAGVVGLLLTSGAGGFVSRGRRSGLNRAGA